MSELDDDDDARDFLEGLGLTPRDALAVHAYDETRRCAHTCRLLLTIALLHTGLLVLAAWLLFCVGVRRATAAPQHLRLYEAPLRSPARRPLVETPHACMAS